MTFNITIFRRKKEKEKLAKLGKLIPIGTDIDPDQISLAESMSEANPLPLRTKFAGIHLFTSINFKSNSIFKNQI